MKKRYGKFLSLLCALALVASLMASLQVVAAPALNAGGWFESLYAELPGVSDSQITAVSYSGTMSGALTGDHLTYLVRDAKLASGENGVRIDIPGLKAGTYSLTVTASGTKYTADGIRVMAYDRSGYAHQVMNESTGACTRYTEGVGAYKDDGTLKPGAVVLYVTDENKDNVSVTAPDGTTVTGIGSILRYKSLAHNQILKRLATNNKALVVRLVGTVTPPKDLSPTNFYKDSNNEWDGDNGYMADMVSGANITIEGIGTDAVMEGWGISFGVGNGDTALGCGKNFEVRNLSFRNVPEDCVGVGGHSIDKDPITHTWVHNCAFYVPHIPLLQSPQTSDKPYTWVNDKQQGDGAMDWKVAKYHTMSYNYFEGYHKTNLIGGGNAQKQYHATWHHNYWKNCESRGPLCRQTDIHIYNNLYENQKSYCMSLRASCFVFSEYNTFLNCKCGTGLIVQNSSTTDGTGKGLCKSFNDTFTGSSGGNAATKVNDRAAKVTDSTNYNPYANFDTTAGNYVAKGDYLLDESVEKAKTNIDAYAGPMKQADEIVIPDPVDPTPTPTPTPSGNVLGGTVYTLTGDEVYAAMEQSTPAGFTKNPSTGDSQGKNPNSYVAGSAVTGTAGTDNFFTLYYTSGTRIDPVQKTFDDGYEAAHRINFSGAATARQNAVEFTTDGPATVKVWWVGGGGDSKPARSMTILDSSGQEYVTSAESSTSTETPMLSTLELDKGGTWYLGGQGGKNFIHKVTVSVGGDDSLGWSVEGDTLSITGDVGENQTVWAACGGMAQGFLSAAALTGTDPTVSLPEGWQSVKLIWLDSHLAPKCPAALHQK